MAEIKKIKYVMQKPNQYKKFLLESKVLLHLSLPLIMSGVIETSVGFFSNIFLAHLGTETLAAGALVNWVFTTLMVIVWGTFSATSTLVARYYGAKNDEQLRALLYAGLLLAFFFMLPAMVLFWNLAPIFLFFGQKPSLVALAQPYLHGITWAIIPDFIITILLQFAAGLGRTRTNLTFSFCFVPLSIFFNYSLMFGKFGLPQLGIAGIGWGAALSFWIITLGFTTFFLLNKGYRYYFQFPKFSKIGPALKEIIHVGIPLGLMYCVEIGFFLGITIVMGFIDANSLSANQVTLQFYWLFSIVTFALAQGITIHVGHSIGRNNPQGVNYATYLGALFAFCFMLIAAFIYWFAAKTLISIDFDIHLAKNSPIVALAIQFFALAAIVQLIEAIRFSFFGALRALKDTRFTLLNSLVIYWVISLPLGYFLAINLGYGGLGIWWAMLFGQIIGTPLLIWRYRRKVKQHFSQPLAKL